MIVYSKKPFALSPFRKFCLCISLFFLPLFAFPVVAVAHCMLRWCNQGLASHDSSHAFLALQKGQFGCSGITSLHASSHLICAIWPNVLAMRYPAQVSNRFASRIFRGTLLIINRTPAPQGVHRALGTVELGSSDRGGTSYERGNSVMFLVAFRKLQGYLAHNKHPSP